MKDNAFIKDKNYIDKESFFFGVIDKKLSQEEISFGEKYFAIINKPCVCLIIEKISDIFNDLKDAILNYIGGKDVILEKDGNLVLIKFITKDLDDYHSINEYAEFLVRSVNEETCAKIKVFIGSKVSSVSDLSTSYNEARETLNFSKNYKDEKNVFAYSQFIMQKVLMGLDKEKAKEYLYALADEKMINAFSDKEMLDTAEEFFENNLNISGTSKKIFLHRNTLNYRLDKIEKTTGLNIRNFSDAVTFRLIKVLISCVKGEK